jgi:hypothetical protein
LLIRASTRPSIATRRDRIRSSSRPYLPREHDDPVALCVDWTEQAHHLSGELGAAITRHLFCLVLGCPLHVKHVD